jgi:hypothetical protein
MQAAICTHSCWLLIHTYAARGSIRIATRAAHAQGPRYPHPTLLNTCYLLTASTPFSCTRSWKQRRTCSSVVHAQSPNWSKAVKRRPVLQGRECLPFCPTAWQTRCVCVCVFVCAFLSVCVCACMRVSAQCVCACVCLSVQCV